MPWDFAITLSIHAPTRGATQAVNASGELTELSIHAPTRGATMQNKRLQSFCNFQSTLLQEERPPLKNNMAILAIFQSTLLQEERQSGANQNFRIFSFNPRSYKRSDKGRLQCLPLYFSFNPRSYKRSDCHNTHFLVSSSAFNPRSYKRSDFIQGNQKKMTIHFQSTLLQEERHPIRYIFRIKYTLSIHAPTRGATPCIIP